ncbi:MAG: hypothetical protein ACLR4Z_16685 [Butyricicoccaceae bacterium]
MRATMRSFADRTAAYRRAYGETILALGCRAVADGGSRSCPASVTTKDAHASV